VGEAHRRPGVRRDPLLAMLWRQVGPKHGAAPLVVDVGEERLGIHDRALVGVEKHRLGESAVPHGKRLQLPAGERLPGLDAVPLTVLVKGHDRHAGQLLEQATHRGVHLAAAQRPHLNR
jgi:hypothetical protein